MKFDLDYFENNNIAINCETEDEAEGLFKVLKKYGVKWRNNDELDIDDTYWDSYEKNTCYEIGLNGNLSYTCHRLLEEDFNYELIKFKDIEFEGEDKMSDNKNKKEYKGWELLKLIDEGIIKVGDTFKDNKNYMYKIRGDIMSLYIAHYDTAEEVENSILINRTFTKIQKPITFFEAMNKVDEGYKVTNEYNIDNKNKGYWYKNEDNNLAWYSSDFKKDTYEELHYKEINSKWYIYE